MQWNEVLAVFVEGFLLTFDGGVVILKVPYLGTFWAVRLSDPHMVGCINMAGRSRLVV